MTISGKDYNSGNLVIKPKEVNCVFKNEMGNWYWNNLPVNEFLLSE
jgi:hypothetical protein